MKNKESIIVNLPINFNNVKNYIYDNLNDTLYTYKNILNDMTNTENFLHGFDDNTFSQFVELDTTSIVDTKSKINNTYNLFNDNKPIKINRIENNFNENPLKFFNCWWCCYKFNTEPVYLPITYKDDVFNVKGNFCSFNCCLSYNHTHNKNYYESESLIYLFYKKTNNILMVDDINIPYAPDKEILQKFGGCMSIEDYRKNFQLKQYNVKYPSHTLIIPELEEITLSSNENVNITDTTSNKLILKRKKNEKKNIDDFFS